MHDSDFGLTRRWQGCGRGEQSVTVATVTVFMNGADYPDPAVAWTVAAVWPRVPCGSRLTRLLQPKPF